MATGTKKAELAIASRSERLDVRRGRRRRRGGCSPRGTAARSSFREDPEQEEQHHEGGRRHALEGSDRLVGSVRRRSCVAGDSGLRARESLPRAGPAVGFDP